MVSCEKWLPIFKKYRRFETSWVRKNSLYDGVCLSVCLLSSSLNPMITFERIIRLNYVLAHLLRAKEQRTNSLTSHFQPTVLVLSIKNVFLKIKNSISLQNVWDTEKMLRKKIVHFKKINNFGVGHFFIGVIFFLLFVRNVHIEIKNLIFPTKYATYGKNVRKENYLFKRDLQLRCCPFCHRSYIFSFIHQKSFSKNKKFNFPDKIYEIQKKC